MELVVSEKKIKNEPHKINQSENIKSDKIMKNHNKIKQEKTMSQNVARNNRQNKKFSLRCLSAFELKIIAVITMTIDHIGAALLPQYLFLRVIGRVAFPIYCYMIVNGLFHTKNCPKYIFRLFLFAIISDTFFDLTFSNSIFYKGYQNVFFTLAIGLTVIYLVQKVRLKFKGKLFLISTVLEIIIIISGCFLADTLKTDYSFYGVLMIYGFYVLRFNAIFSSVFQIYINVFVLGYVQSYAVAALPIIWLYNGEKGKCADKWKWLFYVYYPFHLFVIYIVKRYIKIF